MNHLRLGHSPDSDDAFMFWALATDRVSVPGVQFTHELRDIETLNRWAREGRLEFTAISVHAYAYVHERYAILPHGASMGDGYGPMLVARPDTPHMTDGLRLGIPGELTSAFLALQLWRSARIPPEEPSNPTGLRYVVLPFDQIIEAVTAGDIDAGLIIHEGQLTYREHGLHVLVDLGAWWKERTDLPLPLGVNVIRTDLEPGLQRAVANAFQQSIVEGLANRQEALTHALQYSRGLPTPTADRFVGMYVNDWTVDMGVRGRRAIELFLAEASDRSLIPPIDGVSFVS
ncbi:MAG: ABC transporter substrate-binding protein [Chthonomonadales bacterium]|nr:ABC transporter substrate-binding protein [Chthonomonadales bacterium]